MVLVWGCASLRQARAPFLIAVAGSELAKTSALPFTTIDANVYRAQLEIAGPVVNGQQLRAKFL